MKVAFIFGTRPEAIKMFPIIREVESQKDMTSCNIITAQHREMLDPFLKLFDIRTDYDLDIFESGQTLTQITVRALEGIGEVLKVEKPDIVLVQGDTTTVFAGALAAFYHGVRVGHVEAGLRSGNILSPYPEEANRKMAGTISDLHFAPTEQSRGNLLRENYPSDRIFVVGNTVIDALKWTAKEDYVFAGDLAKVDFDGKRVLLLTTHRRENMGEPMKNIFRAVKEVLAEVDDLEVVFPMHLNPKVRELAREMLGGIEHVHLMEPFEYDEMANVIRRVHLVLSDSGGIQEEAPYFGVPVLVAREETERPEGIEAGTAKLVGTSYEKVKGELLRLLTDSEEYRRMSHAVSPYGDGTAARKIVEIIKKIV